MSRGPSANRVRKGAPEPHTSTPRHAHGPALTLTQVQDDFLDCYGDPEVIGKVGTDIRDNKCSWLINMALAVCTAKQAKTLENNYAKHDAKAEARVKKVFAELKLDERFHAYEEQRHAELQTMIAQVQGMPPTIFSKLLARIYKRKK